MWYALIITLREGLEAALIIGIVLAYLRRIGQPHRARPVWLGAAAALLVTFGTGLLVATTAAHLDGKALKIFEGSGMFLAAAVLTYVVIWMHRQARNVADRLRQQVDAALRQGSSAALFMLAFTVIIREGVETVLFLQAGSATTPSSATFWAGAAAGAVLAALLGAAIYAGGMRLSLRAFFNVTGAVLVFFAAGMLAHGVKEFHEARVLGPIVPHIWDTYAILPDNSPVGRFLGAFLGYDSSPSLLQALAFFGYLAAGLALYFRPATATSGTGSPPRRPKTV